MAAAFGVAVSIALLRKLMVDRKRKATTDNETKHSALRVILVRHGYKYFEHGLTALLVYEIVPSP